MKANDRVRSDCNEGTVISCDGTVAVIKWEGFAFPISAPMSVWPDLKVIGQVRELPKVPAPEFTPDEEYEGACDSEAARRLGD